MLLLAPGLSLLSGHDRAANAAKSLQPPDDSPSLGPDPFTHYAEQASITAIVGEPVICHVLSFASPALTSISFVQGYSVRVTRANSNEEVAKIPRLHEYWGIWSGNILTSVDKSGTRLSYTVNRAFNLTKTGTYKIDFHLDMAWNMPTDMDIQEHFAAMQQWAASDYKTPMPTAPTFDTPCTPHKATVSVTLRILPPATVPLQRSARRQAWQLCRLLTREGTESDREAERAVEAFWCYPDAILLPIAQEELLPVKQMLSVAASEPAIDSSGKDGLFGLALKAYNAVYPLVSRLHCPSMSDRRMAFLSWLTEDVRHGANATFWHNIERDLEALADS